MKLYITGSVASGKSTLARRLARVTGIPCTHLDEVMYVNNPGIGNGNRKRDASERDAIFSEILARDAYIMEDTGRECFMRGMELADQVVLLEIPLRVRYRRIFSRWVKQRLGLEVCGYTPDLKMLKCMFRWAKEYDFGTDGTRGRTLKFEDKIVILRNNREINRYIKVFRTNL